MLWVSPFGISFINIGMLKSIIPKSFKPIIIIIDARINVKYKFDTNTLPVNAQIIPIIEKTIAVPITKNSIWTKVLNGFSSEYPPTYPIIIGSIEREQGDTEAINPPKKDIKNSIIMLFWLVNKLLKSII